MINKTNFKIHGAGPTGSILALALANKGYSSVIIDPKSFSSIKSRSRSYALTHSSRKLFERLGLWKSIYPFLSPFNKLIIHDEVLKTSLNFDCKDLTDDNRNLESIGWIIEHKLLMNVLIENILDNTLIKTFLGHSKPDNNFLCDIEIAADGPSSKHRENWGINTLSNPYMSACVTAQVIIRGIEKSYAYEIFRPDGPFAILPMGSDLYQIVWTAPINKCIDLSNLPNSIFLDKLAAILPTGMEPDTIIDNVSFFPLELTIARSFTKNNFLLIGESAHRFHPVGGQGLNTCLRDVNCLLNIIKNQNSLKLPVQKILFKYSILRYPDIIFVALITHLIVIFYSGRNIFLLSFRYPIFKLLRRSRFIRKRILKLMTDGIINL